MGYLSTQLAHIHLTVDQQPQVLFPKPVTLNGVVVTQGPKTWTC